MERLTIKELGQYAIHGLRMKLPNGKIKKLKSIDFELSILNFGWKDTVYLKDETVLPLLRPLSSLTEEQTDSQYGTLIEQIVKEAEQHCDAYDEWLEIFIDDPDPSRILQAPYDVVQELLAQKFDVFGLIDSGLALPIDGKEVEGGKQ